MPKTRNVTRVLRSSKLTRIHPEYCNPRDTCPGLPEYPPYSPSPSPEPPLSEQFPSAKDLRKLKKPSIAERAERARPLIEKAKCIIGEIYQHYNCIDRLNSCSSSYEFTDKVRAGLQRSIDRDTHTLETYKKSLGYLISLYPDNLGMQVEYELREVEDACLAAKSGNQQPSRVDKGSKDLMHQVRGVAPENVKFLIELNTSVQDMREVIGLSENQIQDVLRIRAIQSGQWI